LGPGTGTINGSSGFGTSSTLPGNGSLGFPLNQVGLNDLLVIEVPFELISTFIIWMRACSATFAYNLEGNSRAKGRRRRLRELAGKPADPGDYQRLFSPEK